MRSRMPQAGGRACPPPAPDGAAGAEGGGGTVRVARSLAAGALALAAWILVYGRLPALSSFLVRDLMGFPPGNRLGSALQFFFYDAPKVLMLLGLVVFAAGVVRSFFTPERTRALLAGRRESAGNLLAALLGVVTPFCSCSAVPLFIGFVTAGVPLGVTFSFLIAAPMVNEIALVLLYGLLGWKAAILYLLTGLGIAVTAGWVLGRLGLETQIEDWVRGIRATGGGTTDGRRSWPERLRFGRDAAKDILGRVWPWVLGGIAVGAAIHGYVPRDFMASIMGGEAWWSVPAAVALGIPMYSNAAGIVPVIQALIEKGAALGTVLAFMMSVIALSLPETVILRKVLKPRLIATFLGVVAAGILLVGYLMNAVL